MVLGQLLQPVQNLLGGLSGVNQPAQARPGFQDSLVNADFAGVATADVTCPVSVFTKIGTHTVEAQTEKRWGYGNPQLGGGRNQGFGYIRLDSTGGQIAGTIRLVVSDAQENNRIVVMKKRTEEFSASQTDKDQALPMPEFVQFPKAGEDSKLIIEFMPDSAATIDYDDADTVIRLPVTVYQ